jgi:hypothetical protein
MNEYNVPSSKMLVDFDFDENKVITIGTLEVLIFSYPQILVFGS